MPKHTITQNISTAQGTVQISGTVTAPEEIDYSVVLAPNTVNFQKVISLVRANVQSIVLQAVGGDVTIKTNSSGAPADTVVMANGQVIVWAPSLNLGTDPFPSADVTSLFLSSTAGATFNLYCITN